MKILVCVKQVCDGEIPVSVSMDAREVIVPENALFRMNRYDQYAMEEALRLKDVKLAERIDAVFVGPAGVDTALRKSLEMGATEAFHILTKETFLFAETTASHIAALVGEKGYDLIITGVMSEDSMNASVCPMTAAILGYPWATAVIECSVDDHKRSITVSREIDASTRESFRLELPAVISVQSGINRPRYPSLSNILRAKEQKINTIEASDHCQNDDLIVSRIYTPLSDNRTIMIDGTMKEKAEGLYRLLHERALL